MLSTAPHILISTGEVSGDLAAVWLVQQIRAVYPDAVFYGAGGRRTRQAGVRIIFDASGLSTVGLLEAFGVVPALFRCFLRIRKAVKETPPQLAILVGHELFNLVLAWYLALRRVPTVCYHPPQVWLWRSVLRVMAPAYTAVFASFPEEHAAYERAGGRSHFVGHHLCDSLHGVSPEERASARHMHGAPPAARVIALLPGSRASEIKRLSSLLLKVATNLGRHDPSFSFILPVADPAYFGILEEKVKEAGLTDRVILSDDSRAAMRASDLAIMAAGTATLEAALLGLPMIIVYRISQVSLLAVRSLRLLRLLSSETTGLPNLIMGREIVPEFRQSRAKTDAIADKAWEILNDDRVSETMRRDLAQIRPQLAVAVDGVRGLILQFLGDPKRRGQRSSTETLGDCALKMGEEVR